MTIAGIFLGTMLAGTVGESAWQERRWHLWGHRPSKFQVNPLSAYLVVTGDLALDSSDRSDSQLQITWERYTFPINKGVKMKTYYGKEIVKIVWRGQ